MEAEMQSNSGVIPLSNIIYFIPLISLGFKRSFLQYLISSTLPGHTSFLIITFFPFPFLAHETLRFAHSSFSVHKLLSNKAEKSGKWHCLILFYIIQIVYKIHKRGADSKNTEYNIFHAEWLCKFQGTLPFPFLTVLFSDFENAST